MASIGTMQDTSESIATSNHTPTSKTGLVLDISELVLSTLATAAKLPTVPYLQNAAGLALNIVKIVQDARSNKDAFARLAKDACELVYAILLTVDKSGPLSEALLNNLRDLLGKMADIEKFAGKKTKRNMIIRTIKNKSDRDTIQQYREDLRQSLDVFGLESSIGIQGGIVRMQNELQEINERERRREAAEKAKAENEAASAGAGSGWNPLNMNGAGGPNGAFVNTGIVHNNSGNVIRNVTKNSNNDSSINIGRRPKKKKKPE